MKARAILALALVGIIPFLQKRVDAAAGSFRAQEEVLYLTSGKQVARLAPILVLGPLVCLAIGMTSWYLFERHFLSLRRFFRY